MTNGRLRIKQEETRSSGAYWPYLVRHLDLGALQRNCLPKLELHRPCWESNLEFHHSDRKWELFLRWWTQASVWFLRRLTHYRQISKCFLSLWRTPTLRIVRFCRKSCVLHRSRYQALKENSCGKSGRWNDFIPSLGDCFEFVALLSLRSMLFG